MDNKRIIKYKRWAKKYAGKVIKISTYKLAAKFKIDRNAVWNINNKLDIKMKAKAGSLRVNPKGMIKYKGTLVTQTNYDKLYRLDPKNKYKLKINQRTTVCRFNVAKSISKSRGFAWDLSFINYKKLITQPCFYCNKITFGTEVGTGLDRINNKKGYTLDNVLPCCGDCNKMRGDRLTIDEMKVAMKAVLKLRTKNVKE